MDPKLLSNLVNAAISGGAGITFFFLGRKWDRIDSPTDEKQRAKKSFSKAMQWLGGIVLVCAVVMAFATVMSGVR
jgi:hypothetical protein